MCSCHIHNICDIYWKKEENNLVTEPLNVTENVLKVLGHSRQFLHAEQFLDSLDSFFTFWKVFIYSGKFSYTLESVHILWKVFRH